MVLIKKSSKFLLRNRRFLIGIFDDTASCGVSNLKIPINKRGIFFTLLAILVLTILVFSAGIFSDIQKRISVQKRVETLNNFVLSVEEDLSRKLFIAGFRSIFLFEKYIVENGVYVTNLNQSFQEIFYSGSLYGVQESLMNGATFSGIVSDLQNKAAKLNANVSLNNPNVTISQSGPWHVRIHLSAELFVDDYGGLVSWNRSISIDSLVPVDNFADPLYSVNTNSLVFVNVTKTPYTTFVSGSDVSNLNAHLVGSYYTNSTEAPSFLDRLEGVNAPNGNGIESLVDLSKLAARGIPAQQKSLADHVYFSTSNPSSCTVLPAGMPSWFRLDNGHDELYQVTLNGC